MIKFLIFTLSLQAFAMEEVQSIVFEIPSETFVSSKPFVSLSDVATCTGMSYLCQESFGIYLIKLLKPGESVNLTKNQIEETLKSEWPRIGFQVEGHKNIKIKTRGILITEEFLLEKWKAQQQNTDVEMISMVPMGVKKRFEREYKVEFFVPEQSSWVDQKTLKGVLIDSEYPESQVLFEARIHQRMMVKALFATKDIEKDELLSAENTELKSSQSSSPQKNALNDISQLLEFTPRTKIQAGELITQKNIKPMILMKRGQSLDLILNESSLAVHVSAQALKDASKGQVIPVLIPHNKKMIQARVISSKQAEAIFQ